MDFLRLDSGFCFFFSLREVARSHKKGFFEVLAKNPWFFPTNLSVKQGIIRYFVVFTWPKRACT